MIHCIYLFAFQYIWLTWSSGLSFISALFISEWPRIQHRNNIDYVFCGSGSRGKSWN